MIKSFADRDTQALYEGKRVRRFDGLRKQAEKRLQILRRSRSVGDLQGLPSTPLEASSGGDRVGHSVSGSIVNGGSASDGTTPEF
jgi:proteic killer suppression protein